MITEIISQYLPDNRDKSLNSHSKYSVDRPSERHLGHGEDYWDKVGEDLKQKKVPINLYNTYTDVLSNNPNKSTILNSVT